MIHYHGTPVGGKREDAAKFLAGRHALVPFPRKDDLGIVADVCKSFVFDNGAFTVWKKGGQVDVEGYTRWVEDWHRHPGFTWALIPDVIDDDEEANDNLVRQWPEELRGVPVWHLHESTERLQRLARCWRTVAIGSSGQWATPGTGPWWKRMGAAMDAVCDDQGRPACRLHGLRMLDPAIFQHLPFASADSTNAAVNGGSISRFGMYAPPTAGQRANVIADRIESHNSSPIWQRETQAEMAL
ncbi:MULTISPECIES: hypothetical protein [unclassified Pseudomonas]|uniref:hypothetical protein n=1 Tax=unclassified Pseudomonas TaxID=196821 RepID=UPI000C876B91|nr:MULTISPECIES: hypothetical protein [unclassified Pseudomonas]PMU89782.1 hypothetical protein C1Y30_14440 [Pseudomonas sp. GW704-F3]PMU94922.1 hypothetical protein C1Y28_14285 [Pseudomonas sp. GW704-F5]PMV06105.1 hypothetical protein C1Y29_07845 [Pseudomonas sp. MPBD4-3]PMV30247.1 hypothetical protein C1Y27_17215 [Pseudomonas sp. GW704-F2]